MIVNYSRTEEEQEEKKGNEGSQDVQELHGVKIYGGGIRGIKALKQHRSKADEEEDEKEEEQSTDVSAAPRGFNRFERRQSKPKRRIF